MKGKGVHREPVQGGLYACKHIQGKERRKEERKEGKGRKKEKEERKRRRRKKEKTYRTDPMPHNPHRQTALSTLTRKKKRSCNTKKFQKKLKIESYVDLNSASCSPCQGL